ncbi:hypothetical protein TNCV_824731 [Trichonephila clavipes]|nr:hypothetical protein TNCV_824731 [Trichonephila clavipes]
MGMDHFLTKAGYRNVVLNVELSPPAQHNACPDDNSGTTVTDFFHDVTGMKSHFSPSPNQLVLRIAWDNEMTLIR